MSNVSLQFLGHAAVAIEHDGTTVLIDPFLTGNPSAAVTADAVAADAILLTHGHGDHLGDTVAIATRTGASVAAMVELAAEIAGELPDGHPVFDPNLGGTVSFDWGWARWVPAWHTSTTPKGTVNTPAGIVVGIGGKVIYHLGDTCLFSDLALPGRRTPIDLALVPVGGHYTMDIHDAVTAAELLGARQIVPIHYDTFPPIKADASRFKADVEAAGSTSVSILAPGDRLELT